MMGCMSRSAQLVVWAETIARVFPGALVLLGTELAPSYWIYQRKGEGGGIQPLLELFPSSTVLVDGVLGGVGVLRASGVNKNVRLGHSTLFAIQSAILAVSSVGMGGALSREISFLPQEL